MKLKTTALVLAALATNRANAQDPYDEGKEEGYQVAEQKWIDDGHVCADAWKLDNNYYAYFIEDIYAYDPDDNWEEELFKEGAQDGVLEFVDDKQEYCLDDPELQCNPLGYAAAKALGREWCGAKGGSRHSEWEQNCRLAAINVCKGKMSEAVAEACPIPPNVAPTTGEVLELAGKCEDKVNQMLDGKMIRRRRMGRPRRGILETLVLLLRRALVRDN